MTTATALVSWTALLVAFCPNGVWDDSLIWMDSGIWREGEVWVTISTADPTDGIL
jgi:hypothetical protein